MKMLPRVKAIQEQLNKATVEYVEAKATYEVARVNWEAAGERLGKMQHIAQQMLSPSDYALWTLIHPEIAYLGMPIGDAILVALRSAAYNAAQSISKKDGKKASPAMSLYQITETLESGAFAFKTTMPLREVNAALIHLKGIEKIGDKLFQIEDTDETLAWIKEVIDEKEKSK